MRRLPCHRQCGQQDGPVAEGHSGPHGGFRYSKAFQAANDKGLKWTDDALKAFVVDPKDFVKDRIGADKGRTRMAFPGLRKEQDVEDLLAFMKAAGGQ